MIRNAQLLIAYPLLRDARLAAELDGTDCVETWVEMHLRQALEQRPEIAELSRLLERAKKDTKKAWRDSHGLGVKQPHPDDQLP